MEYFVERDDYPVSSRRNRAWEWPYSYEQKYMKAPRQTVTSKQLWNPFNIRICANLTKTVIAVDTSHTFWNPSFASVRNFAQSPPRRPIFAKLNAHAVDTTRVGSKAGRRIRYPQGAQRNPEKEKEPRASLLAPNVSLKSNIYDATAYMFI